MAESQEVLGLAPDLRGREIARRRGARDLWISRSHVAAAAAGSLALAVVAFGAGFLLGQGQATPAPTRASLTAELPRDELLQLLARIDGNSAGAGASGAITFPDELKGAPPVLVPIAAVVPGAEGVVAPEPVVLPEPPPTVPGPTLLLPAGEAVAVGDPQAAVSGYTVVAGRFGTANEAVELRARLDRAGFDAWVATELVEGAPVYRVSVGHHETQASAAEALPLLAGLDGAAVESIRAEAPAPAPAPAAEP